MKNKDTVCAVVVTYNRKNLLIECLEALSKQTRPIQAIYLIDNASTDGTPNLLLEKGYIKELPPENLSNPWEKEFEISNLTNGYKIKLYYVRMNKNTGSSGGFHEGVKRGYEKGYDWLWLMDDDAEPDTNALKNLLSFNNKRNVSFLAPQVVHKNIKGYTEYYHHKTKLDLIKIKEYNLKNQTLIESAYKLEANGFVGPLLNCKAIKKSNKLPDKSYFIWWDDTDYTYELFKSFGHGYLITNAIIYHKDKVVNEIIYDWKAYYGVRNRIRFFKKHIGLIGKIVLVIKTIRLYFQLINKLDRKKMFEFSIKELFL